MTEFLRNIAEMERPRGRVLAISLAILILWTAGVMAATTPPGTTIKSQATAEYCDDNGNPLSALSNIISITTLAGSPKLKLQKIADPDPVRAGLNLVYTIQMENRGVTRLTGVVLTDPLPPETTFMSADSGGSLSADEKEVVWNIGNLEVGEKRAVTFTAQTAKDLAQGHLIKNTATIISSKAGSQKAGTITSVNARTPGEVAFFDANWQPAYGYMSGDTINIQVKDPDQNVNTSVIETVTVVLTDPATGDTETVILTETGPNTGIFRGGISTTLAATAIESGILSVAADSRIQATYTDALDALTVTSASALIDPLGIVFDSVTGDPVSGAVVTLRNWDNTTNSIDLTSWPSLPPGQVNPSAPTGADGRFAFPLVPAGDYAFQVTPPAGYTYPSAVADSDMPAGYIINIASRGGKFTLKIGDPQLISDIPVDPPMGHLTIKKTANKTTASIGDLVIYTLTLENNGASPVTNIAVKDVMPHGIAPVMGSSQMDGSAFDDPKASGNRTFTWQSPDLVPNDSFTMSYRAVVGPDSRAGNGINTASASGRSVGRTIASNKASFKIKITG
ncbi:MAG: DUF11 domain-containing protein, partial [Deltaproteobacteria bacterium]|nr:DUF11 domain-containing protein [Deltaproteobacteria bacterium]